MWNKQKAYAFLEEAWVQTGCNAFSSDNPELRNATLTQREFFCPMTIGNLLFDSPLKQSIKHEIAAFVYKGVQPDGTVRYFESPSIFASDVDDTASGILLLYKAGLIGEQEVLRAIDKTVNNVDAEGIIQIWFIACWRPNISDPAVCANVLFLIFSFRNHPEIQAHYEAIYPTIQFLYRVLLSDAFESFTKCYREVFFIYMMTRLITFLPSDFAGLLNKRVSSRSYTIEGPLDLAWHILAAKNLGIECRSEVEELSSMQLADGSLPTYSFYFYKTKQGDMLYLGNASITTAFAIAALEENPLACAEQKPYDFSHLPQRKLDVVFPTVSMGRNIPSP